MSTGKRSMPAGTGVWVVNTVPARTVASASSKESPGPAHSPGGGCPWGRGVGAGGPPPADADEDLLPDALVLVAAVEPVGDPAQLGLVVLDVGVEQQQRDAP